MDFMENWYGKRTWPLNVILILISEFNSSKQWKFSKIGKKARFAVGQKQLLLSMVVTKYLKVHLNIAENHNDTVRMFRNNKQFLVKKVLEVLKVRQSRKQICGVFSSSKKQMKTYYL